jgi:hypothetical protein
VADYSADFSALLFAAFHRILKRRARKLGRIELVGSSGDVAELLRAPDWTDHVNRRLDLEKLMNHLSERSCTILALRLAEYDWKHIARVLGIAVSTAQNSFWQDVRKAYLMMLTTAESKREEQSEKDRRP